LAVASCTGGAKLARAGAANAAAASNGGERRFLSGSSSPQRTQPAGLRSRTPPEQESGMDARHARHRLGGALLDPAVAEAIGALRNPDTTASQSPLAANLEDLRRGPAGRHGRRRHRPAGHQPHDAGRPAPRDAETAVDLARESNDQLARAVAEHPDRFAAFATLPTPDPARPPTSSSARSASSG
jgi:hypothetical protein